MSIEEKHRETMERARVLYNVAKSKKRSKKRSVVPPLKGGTNIVCFDFDDTLAKKVWPKPGIGEPIPEGLELLMNLWLDGREIIVFTARHWMDHDDLVQWLYEHAPGCVSQVICGKPLAGLYIDDLAYRPPWTEGPK